MIPIVTPEEMAAVDAAAPEPVEVLVGRAGAAVAREALDMLGGAYGRRAVVLAGPGNNGADGRECARRLRQRGVRVEVVDVLAAGSVLPAADLYVDAAFGIGLTRGHAAPQRATADAPVLAVDIPSGVDGLTGQVVGDGHPWPAHRTVTFAALKPGLLIEPGRSLAGRVEVADIGLAVERARVELVETADVEGWLPLRQADAHKWTTACRIVAGGPGMTGAATLAAAAAMKAGAGYVQLLRPGVDGDTAAPVEAVRLAAPAGSWATAALEDLERVAAVLVGPGLGTEPGTPAEVAAVVTGCDRPLVLDADALGPATVEALASRSAPTILTPHDGELTRLGGDAAAPDRIGATVDLAERLEAHVLRKGPSTIVAAPDGRVRVVATADQRLATAGTGDVLAGIVVAALARGAAPLDAAAAAAQIHALAADLGPRDGLTAGTLVDLLPAALAEIHRS